MSNLPPPPGWYPDPSGTPGRQRYFDGQRWTDQFQPPAVPPTVPRQQQGPPASGIRKILALDTGQGLYPALSKLQELVTEIFEEDPEGAGETPLHEALAWALLELEHSVVETKNAVLTAARFIENLRQYVNDLERRLYEAGVPLRRSEVDLELSADLSHSIDRMLGY